MAGGGTNEDGDVGFQIAPMVDVVFVLLLFFMAVAGSQPKAKELTTNIPATGSKSGLVQPYIIEISPQGIVSSVFDTTSSKDLPALREKLKANLAKFGDRDPVIIRPDPLTRHERVIDVLNTAAAAGIKNLTFS